MISSSAISLSVRSLVACLIAVAAIFASAMAFSPAQAEAHGPERCQLSKKAGGGLGYTLHVTGPRNRTAVHKCNPMPPSYFK